MYHPWAEAVLRQARREAQKSNSRSITDWHLLRAVSLELDCAGARLLESQGIKQVEVAESDPLILDEEESDFSDSCSAALERARLLASCEVDTCDLLQALASDPTSKSGSFLLEGGLHPDNPIFATESDEPVETTRIQLLTWLSNAALVAGISPFIFSYIGLFPTSASTSTLFLLVVFYFLGFVSQIAPSKERNETKKELACSSCGWRSRFRPAFKTYGPALLCFRCHRKRQAGSPLRIVVVTLFLLALTFLGWFLVQQAAPITLVTGLFLLATAANPLSLILHELGHYLAALALGFKVLEVRMGGGEPIWRTKFGGASFAWCGFMGRGWVSVLDLTQKWGKTRNALLYLAGPVFEFSLGIGVGLIMYKSPDYQLVLAPFLGTLLWSSIYYLWPASVEVDGRHYETDGLALWYVLTSADFGPRVVQQNAALASEIAFGEGDVDDAIRYLELAHLHGYDDDYYFLILSSYHLEDGKLLEATECLGKLDALEPKDESILASISSIRAWLKILEGLDMEYAMTALEPALNFCSCAPSFVATRGTIHWVKGDLGKAKTDLLFALERKVTKYSAINSRILQRIAESEGDDESASHFGELAALIDPSLRFEYEMKLLSEVKVKYSKQSEFDKSKELNTNKSPSLKPAISGEERGFSNEKKR